MHETQQWRALQAHHRSLASTTLGDLFASDPERGRHLQASAGSLLLDYSKNHVTDETLQLLGALADRAGLRYRIDAMFAGEPVNVTEGRPAWHVALRRPGASAPPEVQQTLERMASFTEQTRNSGLQHVVNIGIGGSDLGPAMATAALAPLSDRRFDVRFVSNVDGAHFVEATRGLNPQHTLFVVSSKTFTTVETMTNARTAQAWLAESLGEEEAARRLVAVTARPDAAVAFGVHPAAVFEFWDWVGGRYSLCSAIGLSLMLSIGADGFGTLLAGCHEMDEHFRTSPWSRNLPVLLGLLGVWNRNFCARPTHAVLPYSQQLARLPAYIQQLDMESLGKSVRADGSPVQVGTGPVIWGEAGTNGQHAFHQLLHQGTDVVPVDFIGFCRPAHDLPEHHDLLMANLLAQAEALAFGTSDTDDPHRNFPGDRPSNVLMDDELTPHALGRLVALYEHKVFTQATIWEVNPFDQWGVELGKRLASGIAAEIASDGRDSDVRPSDSRDSSTQALLDHYLSRRRPI